MNEQSRDITVFVVDDHTVVRRGIASFLEFADDIRLVGEAADGRQAMERLAELHVRARLPEVVLLDLQMPKMDGIQTTAAIAERYPGVRTIILTSYSEIERVQAALALGASGYVLKDASPDELEEAIRASQRDEVFLDPAVARQLTQRLVAPTHGLASLSTREREVLVLVAKGLSNRAIADHLSISERTARTHVSNVLSKLNLDSRTQAALVAIREGLVKP
ncbi:LuxR family two component transcriptional regulator [Actinocorallia herbida]|uniref:LuxR family two component transcriptional regulator n=1 Tax=Actinocorallia herbida TaxID=58109 RepID=A0A3N1D210_9ACTN|nr:response regulator transcription factor [Actinocorallia herbida]ROO87579.1 LuxR family two component transcriptional regulator [Actinocorallia herbida]